MEKKLTDYPIFIDKPHVIEWVKSHDEDFAKQLESFDGTFCFDNVYFCKAMETYLLAIPFDYKGDVIKYGKAIAKDFKIMRDGILKT